MAQRFIRWSSMLLLLATTLLSACSLPGSGSTTTHAQSVQAAHALITWPFQPTGQDHWAIVNGYRGYQDHALDGSPHNYAIFAFDFAKCSPNAVHLTQGRDGTCDLAHGWASTVGAPVYAPVSGVVAWPDESCHGLSIAIDGHTGMRLALFHIDPLPGQTWTQLARQHAQFKQGDKIGTVSAGGCIGIGDHIHMALYACTDCVSDPATERTGIPFYGLWNIGNCPYKDDKYTPNQHLGSLVPCAGSVLGASTSTISTPTPTTPAGTVTEFTLPKANGMPNGITAGPDGNLWFTYDTNHIGRISPSGVITEIPIPQPSGDEGVWGLGITTGPDGNLWFTEDGGDEQIARLTPSGHLDTFPLAGGTFHAPRSIIVGPNGDLWITNFIGAVYRMTTSGNGSRYPVSDSSAEIGGITLGPDGNLWFTEGAASDNNQVFGEGNSIGRMTASGSLTEFSLATANAGPGGIVSGPDGNLWFTETGANRIGRITPTGAVTEYPLPKSNSRPDSITRGPDGNLWFTEVYGIGRITVQGDITVFPVTSSFTGGPAPYLDPYQGIAVGPDGNLWFIDPGTNKIGEMTP